GPRLNAEARRRRDGYVRRQGGTPSSILGVVRVLRVRWNARLDGTGSIPFNRRVIPRLPTTLSLLLCLAPGAMTFGDEARPANPSATPVLSEAQRDFMTWRFGMFVHFHLGTFADRDWAGGYEDPGLFRPAKLDCGQWADAARAAGMTYL